MTVAEHPQATPRFGVKRWALQISAREREVRDALWLLCSIVWILVPLVASLPLWTSVVIASFLIWRAALTLNGRRLPQRVVVFTLMLACGVAVFLQFHSIFGKDAGVAFVVLLLGLKLLELKARRDTFVVIFLCIFLMLTGLFESQSIGAAIWLFLGVLWLITALVRMNLLGREPPLRVKLLLAAQMTFLAVPLTIVIFLFFPRIEGPLWGMPADAYSRRAGLSDSMSPGSFDKLVQSDALTFEVRFEGQMPNPRDLYWRGPVLGSYVGTTWRPIAFPNDLLEAPLQLHGDPAALLIYTVTLEATDRSALYLLDAPGGVPEAKGFTASVRPDLEVSLQGPLRERVHFQARSYTRFRYGLNESSAQRAEWLQLPRASDPKTRAFAQHLREQEPNDRKLVDRVLKYIKTENFYYSTDAPLLGRNAVDDFWFGSRRGFCEHYASAFVVIMRAAGIAARVVTGYQGGEINPVTGYLMVRQKDAHAWAEVWLAETGWTRIDPTAAIAPSRILIGSDDPASAGHQGVLGSMGGNWLRWARYNFDAVNTYWNQWVVSYSDETQKSIFSQLGLPDIDWSTLTIVLILSCGLVVAVLGGCIIVRRPRPEPIVALYLKLCDLLGQGDLKRRPNEGPRDYFARIAPTLAEPQLSLAKRAFNLYEQCRYARAPENGEGIEALRACVKELRS